MCYKFQFVLSQPKLAVEVKGGEEGHAAGTYFPAAVIDPQDLGLTSSPPAAPPYPIKYSSTQSN